MQLIPSELIALYGSVWSCWRFLSVFLPAKKIEHSPHNRSASVLWAAFLYHGDSEVKLLHEIQSPLNLLCVGLGPFTKACWRQQQDGEWPVYVWCTVNSKNDVLQIAAAENPGGELAIFFHVFVPDAFLFKPVGFQTDQLPMTKYARSVGLCTTNSKYRVGKLSFVAIYDFKGIVPLASIS